MGLIGLLLISAGLAMDAFAVSVCKGLSAGKTGLKQALSIGLWFGGFQALMPLLGYVLGKSFASAIEAFDHWIAFGLLAIIGINMIRESANGEKKDIDPSFSFRTMLLLAIATSIDALACGVSFALIDISITEAVIVIGTVTFVLSVAGLKAGSFLGDRFNRYSGIAGGVILVCIGLKILIEHLAA